MQKFKETEDSIYIYRNELDKACFQHAMVCGDFKDLARRTVSDKVLKGKGFSIAKNPKYIGYQRGLASVVYNFFDKKSRVSGVATLQKEQLAEELHKPIIKKFKRRKVYSSFKGNICGDDVANIQLISTFNKGFRFLLGVTDIANKHGIFL